MSNPPQHPDLRTELLDRAERDRQARSALSNPPTPQEWARVRAVDAENTPWLRAIIDEHGWPGSTLVGTDGAHAAWLLAQHAPPELRRHWLPLLHEAVQADHASPVDLAYLDDRVRTDQQLPQRHGTQWRVDGPETRLLPLDDPPQVNTRRRALGLPEIPDNDLTNALPPCD
ncbi:DUF6624 domain-containing protein [Saccharopolyspora cebuensis]|uniref:DUF6624 domain-containing protein n=1 Tax=Saccharopolyspora cebuensis TaxID=418759 RepID=A0ABV4CGE2_9PSEU